MKECGQVLNMQMFKHIKQQAQRDRKTSTERSLPDDDSCRVRNASIGNRSYASSSIICGNTSPSIEPFRANVYAEN